MGMDSYIRVKTECRKYEGATGACSGLFDMAPTDNGMVEIGYLRKAYDQDAWISWYLEPAEGDTNCKNVKIKDGALDDMITEVTDILATHEFDEEGYDVTPDFDSFSTWQSKRKWEELLKTLQEAKKIKEEDPAAEFYYCVWY